MNKVVKQLDLLRELTMRGSVDNLIAMTVKKLLETKSYEYEKQLKNLACDLDEFEKKYGMSSDEFYKKFETGQLGDAMDFVEWASLYDMFTNIRIRRDKLTMGLEND